MRRVVGAVVCAMLMGTMLAWAQAPPVAPPVAPVAAPKAPPVPCEAQVSMLSEQVVQLQVALAEANGRLQLAAIARDRQGLTVGPAEGWEWVWDRNPQTGFPVGWVQKPKAEKK